MKSKYLLKMAMLFLFLPLAACAMVFGEEKNAILAYGTEDQIKKIITKNESLVQEYQIHKFKIASIHNEQVLILNETTAKKLIKKELLNVVSEKNTVKPLGKLPISIHQNGILFAKKQIANPMISEYKLTYEGNVIIGDLRIYGNMYAVVSDSTYKKIQSPQKTLGILQFDKNPINELPRKILDIEDVQLVKVKP